tara:strand:+ start:2333 stop:2857 length:525 start_codon:yes stop_codon:yes gene_type:complete
MKITRSQLRKLIMESVIVTPGMPDPNPRVHNYKGVTYNRTSTKAGGKEGVETWEGNNKKYTIYPRYDLNISSKGQLEALIDHNMDDASKAASRKESENAAWEWTAAEQRNKDAIAQLTRDIKREEERLTPEEREAAESIDLGDLDPKSPEMIARGIKNREKFANRGMFSRFFKE